MLLCKLHKILYYFKMDNFTEKLQYGSEEYYCVITVLWAVTKHICEVLQQTALPLKQMLNVAINSRK